MNTLTEYAFLTSTFGINFKRTIEHIALREEHFISLNQTKKAKKNTPDLYEFIGKKYFDLKSLKPEFELKMNTKIQDKEIELNKYRLMFEDSMNSVHKGKKHRVELRRRKIYKKKIVMLGEQISRHYKMTRSNGIRSMKQHIYDRMGSISLFAAIFTHANIQDPNRILFYIHTSFVQLFYDPNTDYLSLYSPLIITPDYARKNKVLHNDDRYKLQKDISDFEMAKSIMRHIESLHPKASQEDVKTARMNAFQNYKRHFDLPVTANSLGWISNYPIINKNSFLVNDDILALVLMCLSFRDEKKRNAIKRLLVFTIYINSMPVNNSRIHPKLKRTGRKKKIVETNNEPTVMINATEKTQISDENAKYKQLITELKNSIKETPKEHHKSISMTFDESVYELESIIKKGVRANVLDLKGDILFWVFLNMGLFNLTTFLDNSLVLKWKKESYREFMALNKNKLLRVMDVLDNIKYYYTKQYRTDRATIEDLKISLDMHEFQKEIFLKANKGVGPVIFLFHDQIIGWRLARNYFQIHNDYNN